MNIFLPRAPPGSRWTATFFFFLVVKLQPKTIVFGRIMRLQDPFTLNLLLPSKRQGRSKGKMSLVTNFDFYCFFNLLEKKVMMFLML